MTWAGWGFLENGFPCCVACSLVGVVVRGVMDDIGGQQQQHESPNSLRGAPHMLTRLSSMTFNTS